MDHGKQAFSAGRGRLPDRPHTGRRLPPRRRATGVESYLERHGMPATKLHETSRGALDATGHDESGWRMDRRVDVNLAM
jgi:hypothetical protein